MRCECCGETTKRLILHEQALWCPACHEQRDLNPATFMARDEIPGGVIVENYGPHPMRFDSHSERRAFMRTPKVDPKTGQTYILTEKESFAPMPGTDKDAQGIPNPAGYLDPVTIRNAAELICRNGRRDTDPGAMGGEPLDLSNPDDVGNEPGASDPAFIPISEVRVLDKAGERRLFRLVNAK